MSVRLESDRLELRRRQAALDNQIQVIERIFFIGVVALIAIVGILAIVLP